jgi:heme oxygenase
LGHFILVVGGFTGDKGYQKLLHVESWLSEIFLKATADSN